MPIVLVPGLAAAARLYAPQIAALWRFGPVMVADHRQDDDDRRAWRRASSPRRRRGSRSPACPWRLHRLRDDAAGARAHREAGAARHLGAPRHAGAAAARHAFIEMAEKGRFSEVVETLTPRFVQPAAATSRRSRRSCMPWRPRPAPRPSCASRRPSSRGRIRGRSWRRSAARRWCWSARRRADPAGAGARDRRRHSRRPAHHRAGMRASLHPRAARGGERGASDWLAG